MSRCWRIILVVLVAVVVYSGSGWSIAPPAASGQGTALTIQPGSLGPSIRTALFAVQQDAQTGDWATARTGLETIAPDVASLADHFTADPTVASDLLTAWSGAEAAIAAQDSVTLATARGTIWTSMLRGAYAETVAAARNGDAATASAWLQLREFRPTTRFERPNANASVALRDLANGEISGEEAVYEVTADLLDTYQAELTVQLSAIKRAADQGFAINAAEAVALARGYWHFLVPAYAEQLGADAASVADGQFAALDMATKSGNLPGLIAPADALITVDRSFRAAPLSEEDQSRRAGQLVRYLSLVPVEYGRGVRNGEVIADIEISEAQAFITGARASFDDLYLMLSQQDKAKADQVNADITWLEQTIAAASTHTAVADPKEVKARSESAADTLGGMFPETWTRSGGQADFDVISSLLDQMETAVKAGQFDKAESARLEAYAIYELGAEKRLLAFAPDLANKTETLFWGGNGDTEGLAVALSRRASPAEIHEIRIELDKALMESQERVGAGRPPKAVVIFNAATIVFREGLEGVLILASLVASMIGANRKFKRPLVIGAVLALGATALLFWAAQTVLHSLARYGEKLEAIISLVAIGVLLVIMNWFFHKVYWTKWISKHHNRRRALVGGAAGQALGLVILGFTSVFREGAETVLFLQALVLDSGTMVVIEGTALGLVGVAIVGALVMVLQKKLPHKKMLMVTGLMIALVLVIMVGNTVHVMQVVGWAPISPIGGVIFPYWLGVWFGLFATWQGLIAQVAALAIVIGSYYAAEFAHDRESVKQAARAEATLAKGL